MDNPSTALTPEADGAIAALCLMAAFADGRKGDEERARLKDLFETLEGVSAASLYRRVMLGQTSLAAEAAKLTTPALRAYAFEMAATVCDADGATNEQERAFLRELRVALELPTSVTDPLEREAEALADLPIGDAGQGAQRPAPQPETGARPDEGELERQILNAAILNGGLELLPQSLATMAIVPLQMRLVYRVGRAHGYELGREHLKEFLTIAGVGMTSQVVEGHLRKLLGGFAKRAAGRGTKGLAGAATGAAMSFATTYALGQAAKAYYAGGRKLDTAEVRALFQSQLERGRALFEQHQGAVQEKARTTNLTDLLRQVGR